MSILSILFRQTSCTTASVLTTFNNFVSLSHTVILKHFLLENIYTVPVYTTLS